MTIILTSIMMAGCSMFPSSTTLSMTQKIENYYDKPSHKGDTTIKLQQDFKWQ